MVYQNDVSSKLHHVFSSAEHLLIARAPHPNADPELKAASDERANAARTNVILPQARRPAESSDGSDASEAEDSADGSADDEDGSHRDKRAKGKSHWYVKACTQINTCTTQLFFIVRRRGVMCMALT